jgi:16S rRNA (cytosine1402-N4)-methyltransferase
MRMNQKSDLDAIKVLNQYEESDLHRILKEYGELRNAPRIAKEIVASRQDHRIQTVDDLKKICAPLVPARIENKQMAQVFQAIRIEVNLEMEALYEFLVQSKELLKVGGRLSVISYHSLEDRPVKRYIRSGLFEGEPEKDMFGRSSVPFKKVGGLIVPSKAELKENSRARSAKLRIAERLDQQ